MVWALAALVRSCRHAAITAGGEFHPALRTLVSGTGPDQTDSRQCRHFPLSRGFVPLQAVTIQPSSGSNAGRPQRG
jgi:hypothetical protein